MLSRSAWANIAQINYAHNADNVGPQSTVLSMLSKHGQDNLAQESYWCNIGAVHIDFLFESKT